MNYFLQMVSSVGTFHEYIIHIDKVASGSGIRAYFVEEDDEFCW